MAAPDLINGLGGPAGFGSNILPVGDDNSSTAILLSSVFPNGGLNFFGTTYTSIYINNNGNLTFNGASPTFTPSQITAPTPPSRLSRPTLPTSTHAVAREYRRGET